MTRNGNPVVWVVNASPVILLAKIDLLHLFEALTPKVMVPAAVCDEVATGAELDAGSNSALTWSRERLAGDLPVPQSIAGWDLGAGESQVLAHCLAGGHRAVLDDAEARAAARVHALPLIGTLGLILRARRAGLIPLARPVIEQLRERGAYLADDLVRHALLKVGE